ncbi:hypothetical protein SAMN02745191_1125 [Anaerorhabdus furcosa]|uniref:Uncharacterized protein n=1 Tax=Anaerorhabdus furcosa TaxID=118967 RepID=A0A1T4M0Q2_9FIRM|nr:hypothetical protein SAMN02745191_1125 [Anaerorhabdus furcosa]
MMNEFYRRALILALVMLICSFLIDIFIGLIIQPKKNYKTIIKVRGLLIGITYSALGIVLFIAISWPLTNIIQYLVNLW